MNAATVLSGEARWCVEHADALTFLRSLPDNSVDSLVTDPPAGIGFMGREWDKDKGGSWEWIHWLAEIMRECHRVLKPGAHGLVWALPRTSHWTAVALEMAGFEIRDCLHHAFGSGFPKSLAVDKAIDAAAGAKREVVGTMTLSGTAAMSLEEKGGTYSAGIASNGHKKTIEITRASTEAAKQWEGWGTALKPSHEDWWLVRKPLEGTVASNVQKYGTGALNVDGCRVGETVETWPKSRSFQPGISSGFSQGLGAGATQATGETPPGRWPPNLLLTHSAECLCLGMRSVKANPTWDTPNRDTLPSSFTGSAVSRVRHGREGQPSAERRYTDRGAASFAATPGRLITEEEIEVWQCVDDCPVRAMDVQSGESVSGSKAAVRSAKSSGFFFDAANTGLRDFGDSGTASRFFPQFSYDSETDDPEVWPSFIYAAKPSRRERDAGLEHFRSRTGGEATGREDDSDGTHSPRAGAGRNGGAHNVHPTVKSVALIRYLQRLVTPPGGVTLDLFTGSGTHGVAAHLEGFRFLGCELNDTDAEPFVSIAQARITHAEGRTFIPRESLRAADPPKQLTLF